MAPAERILYTQPVGEFDSYIRAHRERRAAAAAEAVVRAREARAAAEAAARRIGERLGVRRVVLFGSLVRGRFHDRSDIDLAIEGLPEGSSPTQWRLPRKTGVSNSASCRWKPRSTISALR